MYRVTIEPRLRRLLTSARPRVPIPTATSLFTTHSFYSRRKIHTTRYPYLHQFISPHHRRLHTFPPPASAPSLRLLPMAAGSVHPGRIRLLNPINPPLPPPTSPSGPVIYWMFRDQRSRDNWALIHATHLANRSSAPVAVAFNLCHRFLAAHARQLGFMLRGLSRLRLRLRDLGIPFFLFRGDAADTIPKFLRECGASALVTDFSPLRSVREWKAEICRRVGEGVRVYEVDAHNVVPVWVASGKLEYGARTIRKKIQRLLAEYLEEFPAISKPDFAWGLEDPKEVDWEELLTEVLRYEDVFFILFFGFLLIYH